MSVLANFPMVSQLTTITEDGSVSNNAQLDCVAASIGAAILYFQGKTQWDSEVNPDVLKDQAYSERYIGGTAAMAYVSVCKSLGVNLFPYNNDAANLIGEVRNQLVFQRPSVFTEPDPYVDTSLPQYRGWTHVCVFYGCDANGLMALDPYIGKPIYRSDASWANLLVGSQIWILERIADMPVTIDITNPAIAKHFKELNIHQWQCTDTGGPWQGKIIQYAMLSNYKTEGNAGLCGYDILGRPLSNEVEIGTDDVVQFYECGVRRWKLGVVRPCPLYDGGPGTDPAIRQLQNTIAQLKQAPVPPVPTPTGVPPALLADMQAILDKAVAGKY